MLRLIHSGQSASRRPESLFALINMMHNVEWFLTLQSFLNPIKYFFIMLHTK